MKQMANFSMRQSYHQIVLKKYLICASTNHSFNFSLVSQYFILMLTIARNFHSKLLPFLRFNFSHKNSLINATPSQYADQRVAFKENIWRTPDPTHKKSMETHLSNGEYLIHKVPVVYSNEAVVRCLGGTEINAGHPQVYIQLNTRHPGEPVSCKWCGMRYALRHHH